MRFSTSAVLQVALCASSIHALALPKDAANLIEDRAAAEVQTLSERADLPPSASVSLTGQKGEDGKFVVKPAPEGEDTQAIQKRVSPAVVAIAGPVINVVASVTAAAIHAAIGGLASMAFWNPVRTSIACYYQSILR